MVTMLVQTRGQLGNVVFSCSLFELQLGGVVLTILEDMLVVVMAVRK